MSRSSTNALTIYNRRRSCDYRRRKRSPGASWDTRVRRSHGRSTRRPRRSVATYGPEAAHARISFDIEREFTEVTKDDIVGWPPHTRETWREAVERHPDRAADAATPDVGDSREVSP